MSPCQRWQALLRRTGASISGMGVEPQGPDAGGTYRTLVCLTNVREDGVQMSGEWSQRALSSRLRQSDPHFIGLTNAKGVVNNLSRDWHPGDGISEGAAPVAEMAGGDEHETKAGSASKKNGLGSSPPVEVAGETSEAIFFFLEILVSVSMSLEYTLVVAAQSTAVAGNLSIRPRVCETYQLRPGPPRVSSCGSLEKALLPTLDNESPLRKRAWRERSDDDGWNGTRSSISLSPDFSNHPKKRALAHVSGEVLGVPVPDTMYPISDYTSSSDFRGVYEAVQVGKGLVPYARLQHALLRVGTGLSLDLQSLCQLTPAAEPPSHCPVLFREEQGWCKEELAAISARVCFIPAHSQVERWEWHVILGGATCLACYMWTGVAHPEERRAIRRQLPLVENVEVVVDSSAHDTRSALEAVDVGAVAAKGGEFKSIRFRFPPSFTVHAMCRSFALAGEGLSIMFQLASQADHLSRAGGGEKGFSVGSCSPLHVAMRDACSGYIFLLTHSAFSSSYISLSSRPGLVLIPQADIPTCPAALQELEALVRKNLDLSALMKVLSRTVPVLAVVAEVVPDVGSGADAQNAGGGSQPDSEGKFMLTPVSSTCFELSDTNSTRESSLSRATLTLDVDEEGRVRVSWQGKKDAVVNTVDLKELLLEWVAPVESPLDSTAAK